MGVACSVSAWKTDRSPVGSLLGWEHCRSAVPPRLILGFCGPQPAAAASAPRSALLVGLIPDCTDALRGKRTAASGTPQPCFLLSRTRRGSLVEPGFCEAPAQRGRSNSSRFTGHFWGGRSSAPRGAPAPPDLLCVPPRHQPGSSPRVCVGQGRESRQLVAASRGRSGGGPGLPGLPGMRRPGPAARQRSRPCLPSSRTAEAGFGHPRPPTFPSCPPSCFALKTRPEQVSRWQQQSQEYLPNTSLFAGYAAGSLASPETLSHLAVSNLPAPPAPRVKLVGGGE